MEVLVMIGRYAGEVRDIKPYYAHGMIARGEAIDPNAPIADLPADPKLIGGFASGGEVSGPASILVGETVSGFTLPKAVADKFAAIAANPKRKGKAR